MQELTRPSVTPLAHSVRRMFRHQLWRAAESALDFQTRGGEEHPRPPETVGPAAQITSHANPKGCSSTR
jgi:hypothetical protein